MPHDVSEVIAGGDLRASLVALRDRLAAELDAERHGPGCYCECGPSGADGRVVAALSRELRDVLTALAGVPDKSKVNPVDELQAERDKRRGAAALSAPRSAVPVVGRSRGGKARGAGRNDG